MEREKSKDKKKVSYHLQIETKIQNEPKKLNNHLYPDEVITNSDITLTHKITNIGDNKFPGGKVHRINITCIPGREGLRWSFEPPFEISEILAGKSIDSPQTLNFFCPVSIFYVRFQILVDEEAEIFYHNDPKEKGIKDEYRSNFFAAVDRRQVETTVLLGKILKDLKKKDEL